LEKGSKEKSVEGDLEELQERGRKERKLEGLRARKKIAKKEKNGGPDAGGKPGNRVEEKIVQVERGGSTLDRRRKKQKNRQPS